MTIYDIARKAGVSPSTVSRVLNEKPGISRQTRERIKGLLEACGYEPNYAARGLSERSSKTIGLLIADIRLAYYSTGIQIISEGMARRGYCCIILNTGVDEASRAEYIRIIRRRQVEGAILIGCAYQNDSVEAAIAKYMPDTPVFIVNGCLGLDNVYGVLSDERSGSEKCAALLLKQGCSRFAFVSGTATISSSSKLEGFREGLAKGGITELGVYRCRDDHFDPYYVTQRLIKERPDTDAIYYSSDCFAAPGVRALLDGGRRIPEEIKVIGGDDSIFAYISNPKITTLDSKIDELCRLACANLADLLDGKPVPKRIVIPTDIIERETTGPIRPMQWPYL